MRCLCAGSAVAEGEEEAPPEEECAAEFKPLVHLDEVEVQVRPERGVTYSR